MTPLVVTRPANHIEPLATSQVDFLNLPIESNSPGDPVDLIPLVRATKIVTKVDGDVC